MREIVPKPETAAWLSHILLSAITIPMWLYGVLPTGIFAGLFYGALIPVLAGHAAGVIRTKRKLD